MKYSIKYVMKRTITSTSVLAACIGFPAGQAAAAIFTHDWGNALATSAAQMCVIFYFWFTSARVP